MSGALSSLSPSSLIGGDDCDGVTSVGEDDLFTRPHGLDGLGETLVGFTKSKPHVVMILHLVPTRPLTDK